MKINGKAYCLFEQSGTFRDAFKRAGIQAVCVDIDNQDGQTDHIVDLFEAIEQAYDGKPSFLDRITPDDFVMSFFPCIYFCQFHVIDIRKERLALKTKPQRFQGEHAIGKMKNTAFYFELLTKLETLAVERGWRMVIENPYTFSLMWMIWRKPDVVDIDRAKMGDFFHKPTAYWFYGCKPEKSSVYSVNKNTKIVEKEKSASISGLCSLDKSRISPLYADNFIHCFILGNENPTKNQQLTLL